MSIEHYVGRDCDMFEPVNRYDVFAPGAVITNKGVPHYMRGIVISNIETWSGERELVVLWSVAPKDLPDIDNYMGV